VFFSLKYVVSVKYVDNRPKLLTASLLRNYNVTTFIIVKIGWWFYAECQESF